MALGGGGSHSSGSQHSASPQGGGGRDLIADIDNARHDEEWSWTIIGAIAKIQMQYAIEQGLDEKLPKDYFTDQDKLKFFWSGFSNSTATKHFLDILFRSIINWEIILLILMMVFVQVFVFSSMENHLYINSLIFFGSYFSIVCYSLYITRHYRYFVYGDLSSRMMLYLMIGRLLFLLLSAFVLSSFLYWLVGYCEDNPKELYGWTSGIYWIFNLFDSAYSFFGTKEQFFKIVYRLVLPEIKDTANEMLTVFVAFGISPFLVLFAIKILRSIRIKREHQKFDRGE